MRTMAVLLFAASASLAQQRSELFESIANHAARLDPMLQQVRVNDWIAKGAADTYVQQFASAQRQIAAIRASMAAMAQHPAQIQSGLIALFEAQGFHRLLDSLMGGLRKYQNPALADLIQAVAAEDQSDLEKFQQHLIRLTAEKEQEYKVIADEAQHCRAIVSAQPAAAPAKTPARPTRK